MKTWTLILHGLHTTNIEDLRAHLVEHLQANGYDEVRTTTLEAWLYDQTTHADGTRPPSAPQGTLST